MLPTKFRFIWLFGFSGEEGKCTRLNVLSLRDNRLLRLPQELGRLEDLHVLDVSGNR
jgi:protein scribble